MRSGMSPPEAAHRTMDEVGGALISIALTLCAVFVPSAFLSGISGLFFRQFAVTIAASTVISCFVSLTLSPALCAVLFKAHDAHDVSRAGLARRLLHRAFDRFNRGFDRLSFGYGSLTRRLVRGVAVVLVVYAGLIGIAGVEFCAHADRFHSRAGPGLPHHHRSASARRDVGPDRKGRQRRASKSSWGRRALSMWRRLQGSTPRPTRWRRTPGRSSPACPRSTITSFRA